MNRFPALSRWRWPALAVAASLILNGFLIGMIVADWARPHWRPDVPRAFGWQLRRLTNRLPADAAERLAKELEPLAPATEERFQRLRALRDEINQLSAQPQPDRALIDQRLATLRSETAAMQEVTQSAIYDALLKLPPEARAGLAEPNRSR